MNYLHRDRQAREEINDLRESCARLSRERDHFNSLYTAETHERHKAGRRIAALEAAAEAATNQMQELYCEAAGRARQEVMESRTYKCGRLVLSPLTAPWTLVKTVVGLH
jgi:hypothetical protein